MESHGGVQPSSPSPRREAVLPTGLFLTERRPGARSPGPASPRPAGSPRLGQVQPRPRTPARCPPAGAGNLEVAVTAFSEGGEDTKNDRLQGRQERPRRRVPPAAWPAAQQRGTGRAGRGPSARP